jgi:hypothetical protein
MPDAKSRRAILEDAHRMYRAFWGNNIYNIDDILQPVPNYPDVRYLETEHIAPLSRSLLFIPNVLVVRKEYEVIYDTLSSYGGDRWIRPLTPTGGVVIAGQPGIGKHLSRSVFSFVHKCYPTLNLGKTHFLYYLLLRLLNKRQPVAFQMNKKFILFQQAGVVLDDYDSVNLLPPDTWALSDSQLGYESPCGAFLTSCKLRTAWVIQATSSAEHNRKRWEKEHSALMCWMDVPTLYEMMALGKV